MEFILVLATFVSVCVLVIWIFYRHSSCSVFSHRYFFLWASHIHFLANSGLRCVDFVMWTCTWICAWTWMSTCIPHWWTSTRQSGDWLWRPWEHLLCTATNHWEDHRLWSLTNQRCLFDITFYCVLMPSTAFYCLLPRSIAFYRVLLPSRSF